MEILDSSDTNYYVRKNKFEISVDSFDISEQITFADYKQYLISIKKDSSDKFYLSQLPDSSITSEESYKKYIIDKKYEAYPVVGITWEAAMNFCKWKTYKENKKDKIDFIYRLPKQSEWLSAFHYLQTNGIKNDFDKNYSDWIMNLYYEGGYGFNSDSCKGYKDIMFWSKKDDLPRMKRMVALGNSYLFQRERLRQHWRGYYSFKGYRHIAFRILKTYERTPFTEKVIEHWANKSL